MLKQTLIALALIGSTQALANVSTTNSNTDNNQITQSPSMVLSGSTQYNNMTASDPASLSVTINNTDGSAVNVRSTCPTSRFFVVGGAGQNTVDSHPSNYESTGQNLNVGIGISVPFGSASDRCDETARLVYKASSVAYSKLIINSCLAFAQAGIPLEKMAAIEPEYAKCAGVIDQALANWHGANNKRIAEQAIAEYNRQREANMRKVGVDPKQEHIVYQK